MAEYRLTPKGQFVNARCWPAPPPGQDQAMREWDEGLRAAGQALDEALGGLYPEDPAGRLTALMSDPVLERLAAAAVGAFVQRVYGGPPAPAQG